MKAKILIPAALAAAALAALPGSAASGPTAVTSASRTVLVKDDVFSPSSVQVPKNTTLTFLWRGKHWHNVARGGSILLGNRRTGAGALRVSRSLTLNCTLHSGMKLKVRVR